MKYQIHRNIAITGERDETLVLVSRTETFDGTPKELKEHLLMFEYDCNCVARSQLEKLMPKEIETATSTEAQINDDEIPF